MFRWRMNLNTGRFRPDTEIEGQRLQSYRLDGATKQTLQNDMLRTSPEDEASKCRRHCPWGWECIVWPPTIFGAKSHTWQHIYAYVTYVAFKARVGSWGRHCFGRGPGAKRKNSTPRASQQTTQPWAKAKLYVAMQYNTQRWLTYWLWNMNFVSHFHFHYAQEHHPQKIPKGHGPWILTAPTKDTKAHIRHGTCPPALLGRKLPPSFPVNHKIPSLQRFFSASLFQGVSERFMMVYVMFRLLACGSHCLWHLLPRCHTCRSHQLILQSACSLNCLYICKVAGVIASMWRHVKVEIGGHRWTMYMWKSLNMDFGFWTFHESS